MEVISDWFTRKQASQYLQIGLSTLDTRVPINKYRIGKSVRYLKKDLDNFLLTHMEKIPEGGVKNG